MGLFGELRFIHKLQERQLSGHYGYSASQQYYPPRKKKTEFEKFVDRQKVAYPNSWRYFVNRISFGIAKLSIQQHQGKIELNEDQIALLHDLVEKYWDQDRNKLVIKGSKNMNFFKTLEKLVPDITLLKKLYGGKNDWAVKYTTVRLESPINGCYYRAGKFIEQYRCPLLLIYNYRTIETIDKIEKPKLIAPKNEIKLAKYKLKKALVKPIGIHNEEKFKYGSTYWAWLPSLNKRHMCYVRTRVNGHQNIDITQFWALKNNDVLR